MPNYRAACQYAASQGWLIIGGDTLTLTIAGLWAAYFDRPINRFGTLHYCGVR